jgi:AhpD family alkylhydroperoxidase
MYERINPHKVAPELQKPMFALTKHISEQIDPVLFELVKLRASMINGCGHCVDIHSNDALKAGETTSRLFGLNAWWEHPQFSGRERAALALTDAATRFGEHGVPDDVYDAARAEFDERELTYLVAGIGLINMWNRFGVTFQLAPPSAVEHAAQG